MQLYESVDAFLALHGDDNLWFFTTKGKQLYSDVPLEKDAYLVFVVTFDAMHMQRRKESRGIEESILEGCYHETREISHNQLEQRSFYLFPLTVSQKKGLFSEWKKAYALVCMDKLMIHNVTGIEKRETRYYLTSLKDVDDAAHCVRAHWNIENGLHWNLDTVFHEDDCMLSDRNAALNQSILNKACLALLSKLSDLKGGTQKISKGRLRKMFGWNFNDSMSEALSLMDPFTFSRAVEIQPRKSRK